MNTNLHLIYRAILPQFRLLQLGQTCNVISNPFVNSLGSMNIALQFLHWYIGVIYFSSLYYGLFYFYLKVYYNLFFVLFLCKLWLLQLEQINIILVNPPNDSSGIKKNERQLLQRYIIIVELINFHRNLHIYNYNHLYIIFYRCLKIKEILGGII